MELVARVRAFLRRQALRGRRCIRRSTVMARLRLTPSELEDALNLLEKEGVVAVGEVEVCYTGALEAPEDPAYEEAAEAIRRLSALRSVVAWVKEVRGLVPHVDFIVVRRDELGFAIRVAAGRLPVERLVTQARHVAASARRLAAGEWWDDCCPGQMLPETLVPVVAVKRGAPRLVEGVPVQPLERLQMIVRDPAPLLADPALRVYRVVRSSSA